ncbi:MAG: signal peptidase I [Actinomycetota bacterium]
MTIVADPRDTFPDPEQPDPGSTRDRSKRSDEGRFYLGLVALIALLVFGTLAVVAVLPMIVPGYTSATITSGSMQPKLRPGDVVIAVDTDELIDAGTIIVFQDPDRGDLVTHRIVEMNENGTYTTKGDANGVTDARPIPQQNVKGEGKWVVPFVGLPRVWVANGEWMPIAFTIVISVLVLWFVRYALESEYDPWRVEESEEEAEPIGAPS